MVNSAGTAVTCLLTGDAGPVPTLLWWLCDSDSAEAAAESHRYWNGAGLAGVSSGVFCFLLLAVCDAFNICADRAEPINVCVTSHPCFCERALFSICSLSQRRGVCPLPAMASAVGTGLPLCVPTKWM